MTDGEGRMPLEDLSGYIDSVRRDGQGEYVPVVEMGRIAEPVSPSVWPRAAAFMAAASVLLAVGAVAYTAASTAEIRVASDGVSSDRLVGLISEEGGRVFSVSKGEDGSYRVRVFAFGGIGSLVGRLKERGGVEGIDVKD